MAEHLIQTQGPLLDDTGRLREPGYALRPPFYYNRSQVGTTPVRIKEWDYYLANDDCYALALTVSDLGYVGLVSASVVDLAQRTYTTATETVPLTLGRMNLPRSSDLGDVEWSNERCRVTYRHVRGMRRLSFFMSGFDGDADLEAELLLDRQPRDSMVIATPWDEDPAAFYYNRKIVGMRARGGFRAGALYHEFDGTDSLALLDWGRGVWTYDNTWYWAFAQGHQDGRVVAMNLGYGFGNTSAASENMVFVDGVASKLGRVDFGIPRAADGTYDYLRPWHLTDDQDRLRLTFQAQIDRTDKIDVAGVITSDQHQVFGRLTGWVVLDDGSRLEVEGLRGAAEHVHNRY